MKSMKEFGTVIFITVIAVSALYAIAVKVKPTLIKPENAIEEFLEDQLENQLGLDDGQIDLTPDSKEK